MQALWAPSHMWAGQFAAASGARMSLLAAPPAVGERRKRITTPYYALAR